MSLWFKPYTIADIEFLNVNLAKHIGIEFTEIGPDFLRGRMPVDDRTRQPFGILHGGASVALAETLGSVGAAMIIDPEKQRGVGQEINANHVRGVSSGFVVGTARALHIGRRSHVWDIRITDEQQRLVCVSRLTMSILDREPAKSLGKD
jgi:1,4-dihydroxy-2-naphthoyl-CoA hydrolase